MIKIQNLFQDLFYHDKNSKPFPGFVLPQSKFNAFSSIFFNHDQNSNPFPGFLAFQLGTLNGVPIYMLSKSRAAAGTQIEIKSIKILRQNLMKSSIVTLGKESWGQKSKTGKKGEKKRFTLKNYQIYR